MTRAGRLRSGVAGVLAALALAACGASSSAPAAPPPLDPRAPIPDSCTTADDCALVDACCGCAVHGKQLALRKDAVASFNASRPQRCAGVVCDSLTGTDPTCDAEPICGSRNRCRVAPHMQHL